VFPYKYLSHGAKRNAQALKFIFLSRVVQIPAQNSVVASPRKVNQVKNSHIVENSGVTLKLVETKQQWKMTRIYTQKMELLTFTRNQPTRIKLEPGKLADSFLELSAVKD
jgi:hypothetical protein